MEIDGNLVIRWEDRDAFEVRFVPTRAQEISTSRVRIADAETLGRVLIRLGLPSDRVVSVLASPYVLHSLRIRVDGRAARQVGLIDGPWRQLTSRLARWLGRRSP
jgi:hypothetical protein